MGKYFCKDGKFERVPKDLECIFDCIIFSKANGLDDEVVEVAWQQFAKLREDVIRLKEDLT